MNNKIAIVTGANSGMGLATTIALMKQGYYVVMACRNEQRGNAALEEARQESGTDLAEVMLCDLGSMQSVRSFANRFRARFDTLDVLINNAGVVHTKRVVTSDGFESMIGVNHLGHFLLTNLLREPLEEADQGRVIIVSSGAYKVGKIDFDDPFLETSFSIMKGYSQSKLANLLFMYELIKQWNGTKVMINAVHPGAVSTNLGINRETGFGKTIHRLLKPFFQTPEQGADTTIFLATDPSITTSGDYYVKRKKTPLREKAKDVETAKRLWVWSVQQVGGLNYS